MHNKLDITPNNNLDIQNAVLYGTDKLRLLYEYYIFINQQAYQNYQDKFAKINNLTIPIFPVNEDTKR